MVHVAQHLNAECVILKFKKLVSNYVRPSSSVLDVAFEGLSITDTHNLTSLHKQCITAVRSKKLSLNNFRQVDGEFHQALKHIETTYVLLKRFNIYIHNPNPTALYNKPYAHGKQTVLC